jgi:hypothetical protein
MRPPQYLRSHILPIGKIDPHEAKLLVKRLTEVAGVADVVVVAEEGVAYLKVDDERLDKAALTEISA